MQGCKLRCKKGENLGVKICVERGVNLDVKKM